jgi:hypothetical protein
MKISWGFCENEALTVWATVGGARLEWPNDGSVIPDGMLGDIW